MVRKFNFNPGPATLPYSVLEKAHSEFLDFKNSGMSLMEMSHRSKNFDAILENTKNNLRTILSVPEDYEIIFMGGGASTQFAMIPMNFLGADQTADYVNTGVWSTRAIKEGKLFGKVNIAASSEETKFDRIPTEFNFSENATYVHITTNNTIYGTQYKTFPNVGNVPLLADASSDFMSTKIDISKFSIMYAGAQKNAGPAGVTVIIIKKSMLDRVVDRPIPTMLKYSTHVSKNSLYNTPPVYPIYMVGLVAEWILEQGGIEKIQAMNEAKAKLVYDVMDEMGDYYHGTVQKDSRSLMNIPFRLSSEDLEKKFLAESAEKNLHGLKGHRDVGGIRASIYNAMPIEGVEALATFMKEFAAANPKA